MPARSGVAPDEAAEYLRRSLNVTEQPAALPSKSQLKKAGDRIRKRATGAAGLDPDQSAADAELVNRWRSAHSGALTKTRVGLGSITSGLLGPAFQTDLVTQRLKRFESIEAKLVRDRTRLGEMEDIAGCRAVLPTLEQVRAVHERLACASKLEIADVRDYNITPHAGGYRALHLWCRRDGFKIEVQLRTTFQHTWARAVEDWDAAFGTDVKHEDAPDGVLDLFRALAEHGHRIDSGVAHSKADRSGAADALRVDTRWLMREVEHG